MSKFQLPKFTLSLAGVRSAAARAKTLVGDFARDLGERFGRTAAPAKRSAGKPRTRREKTLSPKHIAAQKSAVTPARAAARTARVKTVSPNPSKMPTRAPRKSHGFPGV